MNCNKESCINDQRIAYLCLCHANPEFIERLANRLNYNEDALFVHVDKKVDVRPFIECCKDCNNVFFVSEENRIKVYWGGYNSIIATFNTVRLAYSKGNYTRFVLLQGQDYPLYSNMYIHRFFEKNKNIEFCHAADVTKSDVPGRYMKAFGYWWEDQVLWSNFVFRCVRTTFSRINSLGIKYRRGSIKGKNVFWGRANWAVTKECMDFLLMTYETDKQFNSFMRHRFPPDELYFHTLIHNSKFRDRLSNDIVISRQGYRTALNLVYSEYPGVATVFTDPLILDDLRKTGCLYVRKVNLSSVALLDEIDRRCELDN